MESIGYQIKRAQAAINKLMRSEEFAQVHRPAPLDAIGYLEWKRRVDAFARKVEDLQRTLNNCISIQNFVVKPPVDDYEWQ